MRSELFVRNRELETEANGRGEVLKATVSESEDPCIGAGDERGAGAADAASAAQEKKCFLLQRSRLSTRWLVIASLDSGQGGQGLREPGTLADKITDDRR